MALQPHPDVTPVPYDLGVIAGKSFIYFDAEKVPLYDRPDGAALRGLLEAVDWTAREGYRLLPHYRFDPSSGRFLHRRQVADAVLRLDELSYAEGELRYPARRRTATGPRPRTRCRVWRRECRS